MSSIQDFRTSLSTLNNIFFKASSFGKRLVGSSTVLGSSAERWRLSLALFCDSGEHYFYERTLTYTDLQAVTKTLNDFSWPTFFNHMRLILKQAELVFDSNSKEMVQLYFPKREDGISTPIDFTIPLVSNEDKTAISTFLFGFVERIHTLEMKLATSDSTNTTQIRKLEPIASPSKAPDMDVGVNTIDLVGSKAAPGPLTEPKKTGGSLLNPRAKKYVPKPTTLSGR